MVGEEAGDERGFFMTSTSGGRSDATMRAVLFERIGDAETALRLVERPIPVPGANEVLVRIEAAGVNYSDTVRRRGEPYPTSLRPPYVLGGEAVGSVVSQSEGTTDDWVGRRVFVWPDSGCYAEYVVVPESQIAEVPADLPAATILALGIQGMTAWGALKDAGGLTAGDRVLVWGAAGGVGTMAVQLARILGAGAVLGAASSDSRRAQVDRLGGTPVDPTSPDWSLHVRELTEGDGVDVVLQVAAGRSFQQSLDVLAYGGRVVIVGAIPDGDGSVDLTVAAPRMIAGGVGIRGYFLGRHLAVPGFAASAMAELADLVRGGRLHVESHDELGLADAVAAHRLLEQRTSIGKVVLRIDE